MNYRDLQNISNLSQQILVEGANEEHNVLNRWPYTSPYLQESTEVDESYKPMTKKKLDRIEKKSQKEKDRITSGESKSPWGGIGNRRTNQMDRVVDAFGKRGIYYSSGRTIGPKISKEKEKENRARGTQKEQTDLYDIILSHLLDEGYAETQEQAEVIMVNMSEDWRESICEATVLAAKGGVAGAVQVKQTKTPGFLGTGIGSKTVSTPIPGTFTRNTPGRVQSGPRPFDAYGSGSKGAEAEMSDRSGPTDAERRRYNDAVTDDNTVGDNYTPSPRGVNQRAYQKGHSGLMPTRDNQNSTRYSKPNDSWRGY